MRRLWIVLDTIRGFFVMVFFFTVCLFIEVRRTWYDPHL